MLLTKEVKMALLFSRRWRKDVPTTSLILLESNSSIQKKEKTNNPPTVKLKDTWNFKL